MLLKKIYIYNAKIKNIENKIPEITNVATKTTLNAKISEVKGEISSITNLDTNASLNAKINEVQVEIPNITNLTTTSALIVVKNKKNSASNSVNKTDYNTNITEIEKKIIDHNHNKCITTPEFNKLTAKNFTARLKQANLAIKNDIASFVKKDRF